MAQKTDADGYVTKYNYDPRDLVDSINYSDGKKATFVYNKNGELVTMTDWNGTTTFELDLLGRITSVNDPNSKTVRHTYDAVGNQTSIDYPDGTSAKYEYDLLGRMTAMTDAENQRTAYSYDAEGQLTAMSYPNGWSETYAYDAAGHLISQYAEHTNMTANKPVIHTYKYDPEGNVIGEYRSGAGTQKAFNLTHTYDALNRMTSTTGEQGEQNQTYFYDSLGNLTAEITSEKVKDYRYNTLNQQVQRIENGRDFYNFYYDKRGNLVKGVHANKNRVTESYYYDATNRMVSGINSYGDENRYIYNGLGHLIANELFIEKNTYGYYEFAHNPWKRMMSVRKDYVLDYTSEYIHAIMEQESGINGLTYRYNYGLEKVSTVIYPLEKTVGKPVTNHGEIKLYSHHDRQGSGDYLTHYISGRVESYAEYDPWGKPTMRSVIEIGQRVLDLVTEYTGHPYDDVLDMYYARARMYDAADRRFTSVDAVKGLITNPQTLTAYYYCMNNPLKYTDPTGDWAAGDEKLTPESQMKIKDLTEQYGKATTQAEKDKLHKEAVAIRANDGKTTTKPSSSSGSGSSGSSSSSSSSGSSSKRYEFNDSFVEQVSRAYPSAVGEVLMEIIKKVASINPDGKAYLTASEWSVALNTAVYLGESLPKPNSGNSVSSLTSTGASSGSPTPILANKGAQVSTTHVATVLPLPISPPIPVVPGSESIGEAFRRDLGRFISGLMGRNDPYKEPDPYAGYPIEIRVAAKAFEFFVGKVATGGSTPATPPEDPDDKDSKRNWERTDEKQLEKKLKEQGEDPHSVKYEYLGDKAQVSRFDIKVDKNTGQLGIFEKATGKLVEITHYFIK